MTKRALGIAVALLLITTAFLIAVDPILYSVGDQTRRTPTVPLDFTVESMNNRIKLTWSDPQDIGDSSKIGFTIWRGPDSNPNNLNVLANKGPFTFEHTDSGLMNGKYYFYAVQCVNEEGVGDMSEILSAKPVGPAGVPGNISVTYGSNIVHFEWEPPEDDGGDDITGYRIMKGPNEAQLNTIIDLPVSTSYDDTNVVNGVSYSYKIRASNSFEVNGTVSRTFSITPRGVSSPPTNFNITGLDRKIQLNWTYPSDDGGTGVMGYKVYRGLGVDDLIDYAYVSSLMGYLDKNITNGLTYFYAISAVNSEGEGGMTEIKSVTPIGIPEKPLNLTVLPGDAEAYLEWKTPKHDGGSEIIGYKVFRTTQGAQMELVGNAGLNLEFTDTNLTNGNTYYYQVRAYNDQGDGFPSDTIDIQPDFAPAAPSNFRVKEDQGFNKLIWSHASVSIDYPVTEYRLFKGPAENDLLLLATLNVSFATYEDYDVEVGVEYYYMIRSYSAIGEGPPSPVVVGIPFSPPTVALDLNAEIGDMIIRLTWSEPDFDGGREIINYKVYRGENQDNMAVIETISGSMTMYNDTNVVNGRAYYYSVMPVNEEREGDLTTPIEAMPLGPPQKPRNLVISAVEDAILLEWSPPLNEGGRAVTGYRILRGTSQLDLTEYVTVGAVLNYTDAEIEKGINYYYAIVAMNSIGDGKTSAAESGVVYEEISDKGDEMDVLPLIVAGIVAVLVITGLVIFVVIMSKRKKKEEQEGKQEFEESEKEREHRLVLERREKMKEFTDVALNTAEAHEHDRDEHNFTYEDLYGNTPSDEPEEQVETGDAAPPEEEVPDSEEGSAPPEAPEYEASTIGEPPETQPAPPEQVTPPEQPQGEQSGEYIPPQQE